jgi:hypothetical protein
LKVLTLVQQNDPDDDHINAAILPAPGDDLATFMASLNDQMMLSGLSVDGRGNVLRELSDDQTVLYHWMPQQVGGGRQQPSPPPELTPTHLRTTLNPTKFDDGTIHKASARRSCQVIHKFPVSMCVSNCISS